MREKTPKYDIETGFLLIFSYSESAHSGWFGTAEKVRNNLLSLDEDILIHELDLNFLFG